MSGSLLKPCPLCGGTLVIIHPSNHWTGMRNVVLSVELKHWCEPSGNRVQAMYLCARGKTEEEAAEMWNRRFAVS